MKLLHFNSEEGWAIYERDDGQPDVTHLVCKTKNPHNGKEKTVMWSHPERDKEGEPTKCSTCDLVFNDSVKMMLKLAHTKL